MSKAPYVKVLAKALNQPPIANNKRSRAELEKAAEEISAMLKGPMCYEERLMLVADRSAIRATIAEIDKEISERAELVRLTQKYAINRKLGEGEV